MRLRRTLPVGVVLIAIGSIAWPAGAASAAKEYNIVEHERIAPVEVVRGPTSGEERVQYAGTLEEIIGGSEPVEGALRAEGTLLPGHDVEQVRVTEYDAFGSRSANIFEFFKHSNGRTTFTGEGDWTKGTGRYAHARGGTFGLTGAGPIGGVAIVRLEGNINIG
jgi:hypothetical protein